MTTENLHTPRSALQPPPAHPIFPTEYMVTEQDALAYVSGCSLAAICLIGGYAAAVAGYIPVWLLCAIVGLALPRWIINMHELLHVYDAEQIHPFICVMGISPTPMSVLTLSYRELRSLHFAHHHTPATSADPDAFHIRGPLWQVFITAFMVPEQHTLRWIQSQGFGWKLGLDLAFKAIAFISLAWIGGPVFLWFWLALRSVYGLADFVFFRLVHCQAGEYGSFALSIPHWGKRVAELLLGKLVVAATLNHDIHHLNPCIAAHHLSAARLSLSLDQPTLQPLQWPQLKY